MDQKLDALQEILNQLIEESGFFGSLLASQEGLIILCSKQMDPTLELESLAAKAASIFSEDSLISDYPEDIIINYANKKIFIQKVSIISGAGNNLLFITVMPTNMRYYRRKINKITKEVCYVI